jgi:hypothetical protein
MEAGMAISSAPRDYRTLIAAASLIAGPLLMAIGDPLHPEERMAPSEQIAILVDHASRWYTAHLLLFVGMMLFILQSSYSARCLFSPRSSPPKSFSAKSATFWSFAGAQQPLG